jgi:ABC-type transport system involved in multi-copper enzyme maturation permease subunit
MNSLKWIKNILILALSLFFLIIGINTLIGSYHINNPMEFLMYFFSASLLILVCIVGVIYFFSSSFIKKQPDRINDDEAK